MILRNAACACVFLATAGSCVAAGADETVRSAPVSTAQATTTESEALAIGTEAYVYFYPLISMEITRRVTTNVPADARPGLGPMNAFHHMREYPKADFRDVVRPNFDTLYSSAWIDLTKEPQIISAPDTDGRYYLLPMLDMWSNVFASPGKRTTGTRAGHWALVPPGWQGDLPEGVERIPAPTRRVWVIGRTQTNGAADYSAVHTVQDGYRVTALSQWGKDQQPAPFSPDTSVDMKTPPLAQVNGMDAETYFTMAASLLKLHPPQLTDWSILSRMSRIGIRPGADFNWSALPQDVRAGLTRSTTAGLELMRTKAPTLAKVVNGWQMNTDTMGVYGNAYLKRAIVAMVGLGANQPEDSIYPLCVADAAGQPLTGDRRYELHFKKDELPPADAFWSVTMYDAEGYQVANELNRFAIGDRDALKYNDDGSLTISIQHENPGADRVSNWLPSPASGRIGVTMRVYAPRPEALDGRWNPPAIRRLD